MARDRSGAETNLRTDVVCHDEGGIMRAHDAGQGTSAPAHRSPRQVRFWSAVGYSMMVLGTIGAFLLMRGYGETADGPAGGPRRVVSRRDGPAGPGPRACPRGAHGRHHHRAAPGQALCLRCTSRP